MPRGAGHDLRVFHLWRSPCPNRSPSSTTGSRGCASTCKKSATPLQRLPAAVVLTAAADHCGGVHVPDRRMIREGLLRRGGLLRWASQRRSISPQALSELLAFAMMLTPTLKRSFCHMASVILATAQLLISTHACAGLLQSVARQLDPKAAVSASVALTAVPGDMSAMSSRLCAGHCQSSNQIAKAPVEPVAPPALPTAYAGLPEAVTATIERPLHVSARAPPRGTPPHAILHCCLRR